MFTSIENKMASEDAMYLQVNLNSDMSQTLLVVSQQQQHFNIHQF